MTRFFLQFILFLIFFSFTGKVFCQNNFQRLYGGVNQEISLVAIPCPSGGLYYLGATTSTGNGSADPVIMKLDDNGQVIWARTIGGVYYDVAGAMTLSSDNGLVYAGSSTSYNGNTLDDLYFFKTDSLGALQWSKTFSTADLDVASAVITTSDNGFAITGFTRIAGLKHVLLIRTDSNGDTLFTKTYAGSGDDQGVELMQTSDGGFVITGKTFTQTLGESDILMMRTDAQGNLLWTKSFGGNLWDEGAGIILLQDGNYLISGSTISFGQGDFDILLLKTDTAGNILWGKTYGGADTDAGYTARENPDGSIVVSGYSSSMGYGNNLRRARPDQRTGNTRLPGFSLRKSISDLQSIERGNGSTNVFLMKVDSDGDTLWTLTYGDGAQDEAFHFSKMNDGGYLVPGFTTSYTNSTDSTQMFLIRTDSLGYSGCHEQDAHPMIDTTNFFTQSLAFTESPGIAVNMVVSGSPAWNLTADDACLYIQVADNDPEGIMLFPNPAIDNLSISSSQIAINTVEIYNITGIICTAVHLPPHVYSGAGNGLQTSIDISRLPSGIYFIKLRTTSAVITKKIIIQKN